MSDKLTIKAQKIFSNTGPSGIVGQFGSFKASAATYSLDPNTIQALDAWGEGINGSCIDSSPPSIQDINGLLLVITKWLYYIFEQGLPEWLSTISYDLGSVTCDKALTNGTKGVYTSVSTNNAGNTLSTAAYWQLMMRTNHFASATSLGGYGYSYNDDINRKIHLASTEVTVYLPTADTPLICGKRLFIYFSGPIAGYTITFQPFSSGLVDGAATKVISFYCTKQNTNDPSVVYGFIGTTNGWRSFNKSPS